jgi:anthranilate synthase/aminodeoxychorismate synthase-like glutamine amidotransferase
VRVLVVDNYDSFTYNLVHYVGQAGCEATTLRPEAAADVDVIDFDGVVVSPGPGRPEDATGALATVAAAAAAAVPLLGVCLGHQCIAVVFGASVVLAPEPQHGKLARVWHDDRGLFAGEPQGLHVMRYHSLAVDRASLPPVLETTAVTSDGVVMGLRHRSLPIEGVQFHPESIGTRSGMALVGRFAASLRPRSAVAGGVR